MTWNPEIDTDEISEQELEALAGNHTTCNGFAFAYLESHENAVVKDGMFQGRQAHCYVYDADKDITIDATIGQFDDGPSVGAWDGDNHPYIDDRDEVYEWESREAFEGHYDGAHSPFIL